MLPPLEKLFVFDAVFDEILGFPTIKRRYIIFQFLPGAIN